MDVNEGQERGAAATDMDAAFYEGLLDGMTPAERHLAELLGAWASDDPDASGACWSFDALSYVAKRVTAPDYDPRLRGGVRDAVLADHGFIGGLPKDLVEAGRMVREEVDRRLMDRVGAEALYGMVREFECSYMLADAVPA